MTKGRTEFHAPLIRIQTVTFPDHKLLMYLLWFLPSLPFPHRIGSVAIWLSLCWCVTLSIWRARQKCFLAFVFPGRKEKRLCMNFFLFQSHLAIRNIPKGFASAPLMSSSLAPHWSAWPCTWKQYARICLASFICIEPDLPELWLIDRWTITSVFTLHSYWGLWVESGMADKVGYEKKRLLGNSSHHPMRTQEWVIYPLWAPSLRLVVLSHARMGSSDNTLHPATYI